MARDAANHRRVARGRQRRTGDEVPLEECTDEEVGCLDQCRGTRRHPQPTLGRVDTIAEDRAVAPTTGRPAWPVQFGEFQHGPPAPVYCCGAQATDGTNGAQQIEHVLDTSLNVLTSALLGQEPRIIAKP